MIDSPVVKKLLNDRSHHIEFNGHLSNHVKHAVVALARLGMSPERIQDYYENYARLTTYGHGLEPARPSTLDITDDNWRDFLGRRTGFASYYAYFDRKVAELGMAEVLRRYSPDLVPGWVGAFTHAAIHLGWALDAESRCMAVEGLAYMAFASVPSHPDRIRREQAAHRRPEDATPMDSLLRVAAAWDADREALRTWAQDVGTVPESGAPEGVHPELIRSGLQFRNARMLDVGHPLMYDAPAWLDAPDTAATWEQLYYAVTLLYLARPGDFVLLHLITSLHAMEQIAEHLPEEQRRDVIACYWTGMLGVVLAQAQVPKRAKLAALHALFQGVVDAGPDGLRRMDWELITARSFEEEEEHNPKLVHVMRRMWERTGGLSVYRTAAGQFTDTPPLPPSFEEPPNE
ncbi:questin oxidase family protein [Streptomyces sp. NPDC058874]|uniref:questin oxidase family protein n=1 Tax=unclassified Streptomyces TaxID=2593676 RepID=UPI0036BCE23A